MKFDNFILLFFLLFGLQTSAQALEITNIDTTVADCPSNGTATITATGGDTSQPYLYAIVSGPVTFPPQLSNVFNSLPPGLFTVEVSDNSGTTVQDDFTITGSYVLMNPTITTTALQCPSADDGTITVSVTGGKAPFEYALIAPSAEERIYQASNTFTGLLAGDYTVQVRDACGNIQTRTTEVGDFVEPIERYARYIGVTKLCGTSPQTYDATLYSFPSYTGINEDNDMEFRIYDAATNVLLVTLPHVDGTNPTTILPEPTSITSGYRVDTYDPVCDRIRHSFTQNYLTNPETGMYSSINAATTCDLFDIRLQVATVRNLNQCDTTTWTLTDTDTNTVVQTFQTNDYEDRKAFGNIYQYFTDVPEGNYDTCYTNCCGETFCKSVSIVNPQKEISLGSWLPSYGCRKETSGFSIKMENYNAPINLILEDAPNSITTTEGTFSLEYNIGDVVYTSDTNGLKYAYFGNVGVGSYTFRVEDNCGASDSVTIEVTTDDLYLYEPSIEVIPSCVDQNSLMVNWDTNVSSDWWRVAIRVDGVLQNNQYTWYHGTEALQFDNIPPGELEVTYSLIAHGNKLYSNTCPSYVLTDTILPYEQPEITNIDQYSCVDGTGLIVVNATKGIAPYTYELYQGGSLLQTQIDDGQFLIPNNGTYDIRVVDSCFNSTSTSVSNVIPLAQPNIVAGFSCDPNTWDKILDLSVSPINGASYEWRGPDNAVIGTERTLQVTPFEQAEVGDYIITVYFAKSPSCISASTTASYTVNMFPCPYDYGDAPASYGTLFDDDGARHPGESAIFLGTLSGDVDTGILSNTLANADDVDNNDDEDGVSIGGNDLDGQSFDTGVTYNLDVTTNGAGYLFAWIDFNRDGDFLDAGENIINAFSSSGGAHTIPIVMPGQFVAGDSYIRFRYSSDASMIPIGAAPDGEVQDYQIVLNGSISTVITNRRITYRVNPN